MSVGECGKLEEQSKEEVGKREGDERMEDGKSVKYQVTTRG